MPKWDAGLLSSPLLLLSFLLYLVGFFSKKEIQLPGSFHRFQKDWGEGCCFVPPKVGNFSSTVPVHQQRRAKENMKDKQTHKKFNLIVCSSSLKVPVFMFGKKNIAKKVDTVFPDFHEN